MLFHSSTQQRTLDVDVDKAAMVSPSAVRTEDRNSGMKDFKTKLSEERSQNQDYKISSSMEQVNGPVLGQVKTESDEDPIWACYDSLGKEWGKDVSGIKTEDIWVKSEPTELNKGDFLTCGDSFRIGNHVSSAVRELSRQEDTAAIKNERSIWENIWTCYNSVLGKEDQGTVKPEDLPIKQEHYTPDLFSANEYLKTVCEPTNVQHRSQHPGADTTLQTFQSPPLSREQKKNHGKLQNKASSHTYLDGFSCIASVSPYKSTIPEQNTLPIHQAKIQTQQDVQPPVKDQHVLCPMMLPGSDLRPVQVHSQPQSLRSATSMPSEVLHDLPNLSSSCSVTILPHMTLKHGHQDLMQFSKVQKSLNATNPVNSPSSASKNFPQPGGENKVDAAICTICRHCKKTLLFHYKEGGKYKIPRSSKARTIPRNWKCCKCDIALSSIGRLMHHIIMAHKSSSLSCGTCGMSFDSSQKLVYHKYSHESPVPCTVCGKVFRSRFHLRAHSKIHREDTIKFFCELCGKGFRQKGGLQTHMSVHTGERPHKCPDCKATFKAYSHMVRHRLMHTDTRPFPCPVCQSCFRTKANVQAHLKTHDKDPTKERGSRKTGAGQRKRKRVLLSESEEEEEEWQGEESEEEEEEWQGEESEEEEEECQEEESEVEEQEESEEECEEDDAVGNQEERK